MIEEQGNISPETCRFSRVITVFKYLEERSGLFCFGIRRQMAVMRQNYRGQTFFGNILCIEFKCRLTFGKEYKEK